MKNTYFKLLEYANKNDIYVSFDPNYRDALIKSDKLDEFVHECIEFLKLSDFTKLSDEELTLITKEKEIEERKNISMDKWKEIIAFANKVGAITCTNYGAIASIPTLEEVNNIK